MRRSVRLSQYPRLAYRRSSKRRRSGRHHGCHTAPWQSLSFEALEPRRLLDVTLTQLMIDSRPPEGLAFTENVTVDSPLEFNGDLPIKLTGGRFDMAAGGSLTGLTGAGNEATDNVEVMVSNAPVSIPDSSILISSTAAITVDGDVTLSANADAAAGGRALLGVKGYIEAGGHFKLESIVDITTSETTVGDFSYGAEAISLVDSGAVLDVATLRITALITGLFDVAVVDDALGVLSISVTGTHQTHAGIAGGAMVSVGSSAIDPGVEDASILIAAFDEGEVQTSIDADDSLLAPLLTSFGDVASSITLDRDTQVFIGDAINPISLPEPGGPPTGQIALRAENRDGANGGVRGNILSSLSGTHANAVTDTALAFVENATIDANGLAISAQNTARYAAAAKATENVVAGATQAYIENSVVDLTSDQGVTVLAHDASSYTARSGDFDVDLTDFDGLAGLELEVVSAINEINKDTVTRIDTSTVVANGSVRVHAVNDSTLSANAEGDTNLVDPLNLAGTLAANEVLGDVTASIEDSAVSSNADILVSATNTAQIDAITEASSKASSATNAILSRVNAFITDSTLGDAGTPIGGDVVIDAANASMIRATADARATADGAGDRLELGLAMAFNRLGVKSILWEVIDNVFETSLAVPEPAEVRAFIANSSVQTAGSVSITADLTATIGSTVENVVTASPVSPNGNTAITVAPLVSFNKLATRVEAYVDAQSVVNAASGDIVIATSDNSLIDADVPAASISIAAGLGGPISVAVGLSLALNEINNEMLAFVRDSQLDAAAGNFTIRADENAAISSSTVAAAIAVAESVSEVTEFSGGGASASNEMEGKSNAFIASSTVTTGGDLALTANNDSVVSALVAATAGSVSIGLGGSSPAIATGVSTADNAVGAGNPFEVQAYLSDAQVTAGETLTLTATSTSVIDATIEAASVALAASTESPFAFSGAGVFAFNEIEAHIKAYIAGDGAGGIRADSIALTADDATSISAIAGAAAVAGSLAGGSVSGAITLGASIAENEIRNEVEAYLANADTGVTTSVTHSTDEGVQDLVSGDTVKDVITGAVYRFLGDAENVDLNSEHYSDFARWEPISAAITLSATSRSVPLFDLADLTPAELDDAATIDDDEATDATLDALIRDNIRGQFTAAGHVLASQDTVGTVSHLSTASGSQDLVMDDTVKLAFDYAQGGSAGEVYRFLAPAGDEQDVDLGQEDYGDGTRWQIVESAFSLSVLAQGQRWQVTGSDGATYIIEADASGTNLSVARTTINAVSAAAAVAVALGSPFGGGVAGAGGTAQNIIQTKTNAYVDNSTVAGATDVSLDASNLASIASTIVAASPRIGVGGTVGVGASIGAAVAKNFMGFDRDGDAVVDAAGLQGSQVRSYIDDSPVVAADDLTLSATSAPEINSLVLAGAVAVAGGGTTGGAAAGAGVHAQNKIGALVEASLGGETLATVTAASILLTASDRADISSVAGAAVVTATLAGTGEGASVAHAVSLAENVISNEVEAAIRNADYLLTRVGDITLTASETASISALTAAGVAAVTAVGPSFSDAGAEAVNTLANDVRAFIQDANDVTAEGAVKLAAESMATVSAGIVAASVSVSLAGIAAGASVSSNTIDETISAFVDHSAVTALGGNIVVQADSMPEVDVATVAAAGGTDMSASAAVSNATIASTTQAYVDTARLTAIGNDVVVGATSISSVDPENLGAPVAVGLAGIAGLVSEAAIAGTTQAFASGATAVAANSFDILANDTNTAAPSSLVVGVGASGVGGAGAVSTADITRTTEAFIGTGADIDTGAGPVNLLAQSTSSATAAADGAAGGLIEIAALVADVTVASTTRAFVDDGATLRAGQLNLLANADNNVSAPTAAVGVGLSGGSGALLTATDASTVDAHIGPETGTFSAGTSTTVIVTGGSVDVEADLTSRVAAEIAAGTLSVMAGVAGTDTRANASPTVQSYLGDDALVSADGDARFDTTARVEAVADGLGVTLAGGVAAAGAFVRTDVNPIVKAFTESGGAITAANVTFTSHLNMDDVGEPLSLTPASATVALGSGGLLADVAGAEVTVTNSPAIETAIGSGTVVNAGNAVTLASESFQFAEADGFTFALSLDGAVGITIPTANAEGTIWTHFDGELLSAQTVSIRSDVDARARTLGMASGFGYGANVNDVIVDAETNPQVATFVGPTGQVTAAGDVVIDSTVQTRTDAVAKAVATAAGAAINAVNTTAVAQPEIDTYVARGGSVTSTGGNVGLKATHNYNSGFIGDNVVGGSVESVPVAFDVSVSAGSITASALADVDTRTDAGSVVTALAGDVTLEARSGNFADASIENTGGASFSVTTLNPTANANGTTRARLLGSVGSVETIVNAFGEADNVGTAGAVNVSVVAQAADRSTAVFVTSSGGVVDVTTPSTAEATTDPDIVAQLGSAGGAVVTSGDVTVAAGSNTDADALAKASGDGRVSMVEFAAVAHATPDVDAFVETNAYVEAGQLLAISAEHGGQPADLPTGTFTSDDVNTDADTISFTQQHGLATGDSVGYDAPDVPHGDDPDMFRVEGLFDGRTYNVVTDDPHVLQLGVQFSDTDIDLTNDTISFAGGHHLKDGDQVFYQAASSATGLNDDGVTLYTVNVVDANTLKLIDPMLSSEGVDITDAGSGDQRLIINLTSQGGPGTHEFVGAGGPRGLLGNPLGDDIVSAASTGPGSGTVVVRDAAAHATSNPNVAATVHSGAELVSAGISIRSSSASNSAAVSSHRGGGFVDVGDAFAEAVSHNTVTTTVQGGAILTAEHDITISADSHEWSNVESATDGGGFVSLAAARATDDLNHTTTVNLNGTITAGDAIVATASGTATGINFAAAESGGLGADAAAHATSDRGIFFNADTRTQAGTAAQLDADLVQLSAVVDGLHARARSHAEADAVAADAEARVDATSVAAVDLLTGSFIRADAVELHADHGNIDLDANAHADCVCDGGDTGAIAEAIFNGDSRVWGQDESLIRTSDLLVDVNSSGNINADANREGGASDGGMELASETGNFLRTIDWESTVIMVGAAEPELRIDETGTIVLAENVAVRERLTDGTLSGPLARGDSVAADATIVVDDIVFIPGGQVLFHANTNRGDVDGNAVISGSRGLFEFREAYESVTIINASDRELEMGNIHVFNDGSTPPPAPEFTIDVEDVALFEFDVSHRFAPTRIEAANINSALTAIELGGLIDNPIGTTRFFVENGDLSNVGGTSQILRTNVLDVQVGQHIGNEVDGFPDWLFVELVLGKDFSGSGVFAPTMLSAEAGGNIRMALRGLLRDDTVSDFVVGTDLIDAGGFVDLRLLEGLDQTTPVAPDFLIDVFETADVELPAAVSVPPADQAAPPRTTEVIDHFRLSAASSADFPLGIFGTGSTEIETAYDFGLIEAGGVDDENGDLADIDIVGVSEIALIHVTANTNLVESPDVGLGNIDVLTNGDITLAELADGLRVGQIESATGDVDLTSSTAFDHRRPGYQGRCFWRFHRGCGWPQHHADRTPWGVRDDDQPA